MDAPNLSLGMRWLGSFDSGVAAGFRDGLGASILVLRPDLEVGWELPQSLRECLRASMQGALEMLGSIDVLSCGSREKYSVSERVFLSDSFAKDEY